jgi:hypothetical protein
MKLLSYEAIDLIYSLLSLSLDERNSGTCRSFKRTMSATIFYPKTVEEMTSVIRGAYTKGWILGFKCEDDIIIHTQQLESSVAKFIHELIKYLTYVQ